MLKFKFLRKPFSTIATSFSDLGFTVDIQKKMSLIGIDGPNAMQRAVIPLVNNVKTSVVCYAETGSGKTLGFQNDSRLTITIVM